MIIYIITIVLKNANIIITLINLMIISAQKVIIVLDIIINIFLKNLNALINVKMMILINLNIIIFVIRNVQKEQSKVLK